MIGLLLLLATSYLVGSIPTAYLVGRSVKGIDIRKHGSGNVGATNVFRVVGRKWGIAVLLLDVLKGVFASQIMPSIFRSSSSGIPIPFVFHLACGVSAIAGHTWTVWLRFKGGKGVATSAGVFLALAPKAASFALLFWAFVFWWKRYVSLASIATAVAFPLWVFLFYRGTKRFSFLFPISLVLVVFILYTHRENLRRLCNGAEKRLF